MKTLAEFIQRLQDDPVFDKQARAFDDGDDLIAFLKRQGYDFTLEQLMREFQRSKKLKENGGLAPPLVGASPSPPPMPDEAALPSRVEALSRKERGAPLLETGNDDSTREQPPQRAPQPKAAMPPPVAEPEPPAGLFGSGGGRHRGFSPQRLKSTSEAER
jgi:predicted ribosomally synthesized peptide with nif11-like leader